MMLILPSFAKINWTLEVLGRRPDGYHEIRTLLQTISLADELSFTEIAGGIEIVCSGRDLPGDETNLAYRAAKALRDLTGSERGVRIEIRKRIPVAGGLGGGSSNAAVTLLALQKLWDLRLEGRDLLAIGSKLGADVPFFLMGGTCVGIGRGDEVYPLEDFEARYLLLVNAEIALPTAEVYANLPSRLTNPIATAKMPLSLEAAYANLRSGAPGLGLQSLRLHNDLEISAFTLHPQLGEIKQRLKQRMKERGARDVLMSGSGSTIFAIFDSETVRSNALAELEKERAATGWWCAPANTLSRRQYRELIIDN